MSPDSPPVKKNKKRDNSKDKDKDKDPNAPKKPANAFFMYCQQQRTVMQDDQKDPNIGHHELTKSLAKEWNNLDTEDKKVWKRKDIVIQCYTFFNPALSIGKSSSRMRKTVKNNIKAKLTLGIILAFLTYRLCQQCL